MNEDIFENIDTKEKAYWLGFLYADGFIGKSEKFFNLKLSIKDEDQLDRYINFIGGEPNNKKYYGPYKTSGKSVEYRIVSTKIASDLIRLGCVYKKSKIIKLPNFYNDELDFAFLLGYYDGDGSAKSSQLTCGSFEFLNQIKMKYNIKNKIIKKNGKYICYRFSFGNDLYYKLISNYINSMPRKRVLRSENYKINKCKCGILIHRQSKFCRDCCIEKNRKIPKDISIDFLLDKVNSIGYVQTGKLFGVSDNCIRKIIKKNGR